MYYIPGILLAYEQCERGPAEVSATLLHRAGAVSDRACLPGGLARPRRYDLPPAGQSVLAVGFVPYRPGPAQQRPPNSLWTDSPSGPGISARCIIHAEQIDRLHLAFVNADLGRRFISRRLEDKTGSLSRGQLRPPVAIAAPACWCVLVRLSTINCWYIYNCSTGSSAGGLRFDVEINQHLSVTGTATGRSALSAVEPWTVFLFPVTYTNIS